MCTKCKLLWIALQSQDLGRGGMALVAPCSRSSSKFRNAEATCWQAWPKFARMLHIEFVAFWQGNDMQLTLEARIFLAPFLPCNQQKPTRLHTKLRQTGLCPVSSRTTREFTTFPTWEKIEQIHMRSWVPLLQFVKFNALAPIGTKRAACQMGNFFFLMFRLLELNYSEASITYHIILPLVVQKMAKTICNSCGAVWVRGWFLVLNSPLRWWLCQ